MRFNQLLSICFLLFFFSTKEIQAQNTHLDSLLDHAYDIRRENFKEADSMVNWIIQYSSEIGDNEIRLRAYQEAASIHIANGFFKEADIYFKKGYQIADSLKSDYWASKLAMSWAQNLMSQNRQTEAIEKGLKSINLARSSKDTVHLIKSLVKLSTIANLAQNDNMAFKYGQESLELARTYGDSNLMIRGFNNISMILGENGRNLEAIDTLKRALKFCDEKNFFGKGKLYSNIAFAYRNLEEYDSALIYNQMSLNSKQKVQDIRGIAYSLGAIGRSYAGLNEFDSALIYIQQAIDTSAKYQYIYRIKDSYVHISEVYAEIGEYESAYRFYLKGKQMDDSLYSVEVAEEVRRLEKMYDLSEKEREIDQLDAAKRLEESQNTLLSTLVLGISISATLIILLLYYRNSNKERARLLVEEQLKTAEKEVENNKATLQLFIEDLQLKNSQLRSLNTLLHQKEDELSKFLEEEKERETQLNEAKILTEEDWDRFKKLFERVHPNFFSSLKKLEFDFTKGEKRLMALMKMNLSNSEISDALGISSESVSKSKSRLKRKLDLEKQGTLEDFVHAV